ncbi:MAG: type II toxin-antitoxin system VapC family toxin [Bradymonadales bacterium]|nr:type II toxin-antitoxin system VapC family toxin [Bradymonadales bacterium]
MKAYLDSSVVLRYLLEGESLFDTNPEDVLGSSELLLIEGSRVLERHRLAGLWDDLSLSQALGRLDAFTSRISLIEMSPKIKRRAAEAFPTVVGTLDAIHLATALAWREVAPEEELVVYTTDRQMALCARALGLTVRPEPF